MGDPMTDDTTVIDKLIIHMRGVGRQTSKGYGVVLTHSDDKAGAIYWYEDRSAFDKATRVADLGTSVLDLANKIDKYPSSDTAVKALLEMSDQS